MGVSGNSWVKGTDIMKDILNKNNDKEKKYITILLLFSAEDIFPLYKVICSKL